MPPEAMFWHVLSAVWFVLWLALMVAGAETTAAFAAMLACSCKATLADRKDR